MTTERVRFESSTGPRLAGLIDHPENHPHGWGVFVHGFTVGKSSPVASRICRQLAASGVGMLRFDGLGVGDSEGGWGDGSFSTKVADILKALAFMAERGTPARLLVGHSWGGAAALAAAGADPSVAAVATLAAPSDLNRHRHHLANIMKRATIEGSTPRTVGRRTLTLTRPFLENTHHASRNVADPDRPLLVVHTPDDATASMSRVRDLLLAASPPCTRTAPDDVDHVSASRAPGWIAAW